MWGSTRQRIAAGAGAGAVVIAAAVIGTSVGSGPETIDDIGDPVAAARTADHRPHGPIIRDVPYDCGVPGATLNRLVPGITKNEQQDSVRDSCNWESSGNNSTELEVHVDLGDDESSSPGDALQNIGSTLDSAMRSTNNGKTGPVTDLSGLGSSAMAWTHVDELVDTKLKDPHRPNVWHGGVSTTLVFASGNAAVTVTFGESDRAKDGVDLSDPLPDHQTRDTAFTVATGIARSIGARAATPRVAPSPAGAPIGRLPGACALTTKAEMRAAVGQSATAKHEEGAMFEDDAPDVSDDSCEWWGDSLGHNVDVEWGLADARGAQGPGPAVVAREYAQQFYDARDDPGGKPGDTLFTPVKGLGDEAFAAYRKDSSDSAGLVVFRARNAVVKVRCWDTEDYAADDAMTCAYKGARAAAKRVRA